MTSFPNFSQFLSSTSSEQAEVLALLFEPCEALQSLILEQVLKFNSSSSYLEFIEATREVLFKLLSFSSNNADSLIQAIIAAHPRLGAKKVESKLSRDEQASLKSNQQETELLIDLNKTYEQTFPGLRYVVFVNGRSRPINFYYMKRIITRNDNHI